MGKKSLIPSDRFDETVSSVLGLQSIDVRSLALVCKPPASRRKPLDLQFLGIQPRSPQPLDVRQSRGKYLSKTRRL
jgi:hypothetical protein